MIKFLLTFIILFHSFGSSWILGFSEPGVKSMALDSDGWCVTFDGTEGVCDDAERLLLNTLYEEYK